MSIRIECPSVGTQPQERTYDAYEGPTLCLVGWHGTFGVFMYPWTLGRRDTNGPYKVPRTVHGVPTLAVDSAHCGSGHIIFICALAMHVSGTLEILYGFSSRLTQAYVQPFLLLPFKPYA